MMKKTLSFILLLNFLFAVSQTQETITQSVKVLKNNMSLIILIVLFTFVFSAFAYSFGKILNMGSIKAWAKDQIYEAILSLFIGLVGIFILENFFLNQNFGYLLSSAGLLPDECKNMDNLFEICDCELSNFLNYLSGLLWMVFSAESLANAMGKLFMKIVIIIPPELKYVTIEITGKPIEKLGNDISSALGTAYGIILIAFVFFSFQIYLLRVVPYLFLFFFPTGVLLRSFGLTRKVGGSLIAISVGLTLIYPILIAIGYGYTLKTYQFPLKDILNFFSGGMFGSWTITGALGGGALGGIGSVISELTKSSDSMEALKALGESIFGISFGISILISLISLLIFLWYLLVNINFLAPLVLGILVLPAFIFYVLDNFIRGFSRLAGGVEGVSVLDWIGKFL
jgi:hypothetical protein